jgi:AcrR family transcriptional regulator
MLETTDPTQAQQRITKALLEVVAQGGFEAVSIRTVAQTAGCSVGFLQRQFANKEALIQHAVDHSVRLTVERMQNLWETLPENASAGMRLRTLLEELLSTDPVTRPRAIVWLAFLSKASVEPQLAERLRTYYRATLNDVSSLILEGTHAGEFQPNLPAETCAATLLSLIDGLSANLLVGVVTPQTAQGIVRETSRQLLRQTE